MDQKEAKNLIGTSRNIHIIPDKNKEENIACALALFYTLKELDKNVNLEIEELPARLRFLTPALDHISYPKNFVISIPNSKANVSQIHYEKDENNLSIHLTIDKGNLKKNDVSFYFSTPKSDLEIAIGHKGKGPISILSDETRTLTENIFILLNTIGEINKNNAESLLTGLILETNNLQKVLPETLELAALLMKKGASHQRISDNLYKINTLNQTKFLGQILSGLEKTNDLYFAILGQTEEAPDITSQLKNSFDFDNILVLWKSQDLTKGLFFSKNQRIINRTVEEFGGIIKDGVVLFESKEPEPILVKNKILKFLIS